MLNEWKQKLDGLPTLVFSKNQDCKNYKVNLVFGEFKDKIKFYYKKWNLKNLKNALIISTYTPWGGYVVWPSFKI